ncbi:MAG TPA: hypothetical protein VIW69_03935 [Candidatus Elarobacter sp.]
MRALTVAITLVFVACPAWRASASPAGFSDVICPQATQYVLAVGKLRVDDPPQRVYDATQPAVDAYQRCSKEKLSFGFREAQHYADTRAAGLAVVAVRALIALGRGAEARRELEYWRPLAQQVVDWQTETQTAVSPHAAGDDAGPNISGSDHRKSMYHDAAKEIVTAIDVELTKIDAVQHEQPRRQGSAPAATPTPIP